MDVSKEYVEMCDKAYEIQEHWKQKKGTKVLPDEFTWTVLMDCVYRVWIPLQEQLQYMIIDKGLYRECEYPNFRMIEELCYFEGKFMGNRSLEIIWLSFAMYKLYSKAWDPNIKEWIEVEEE